MKGALLAAIAVAWLDVGTVWGYVPEPQPVKSAVEITAVYYPGTDERPIIGPGLVINDVRCIATCPVEVDGEFHEYVLDLAAYPDWTGRISELWFEACQVKHARVAVDWMRFE